MASLIVAPVQLLPRDRRMVRPCAVMVEASVAPRRHLSQAEWAALTMFAVSVLTGTFLRSGVIINNDLGWRSLLVAQIILVVWSIGPLRAVASTEAPRRKVFAPGVVAPAITLWVALGLASTVYELFDLPFYLPLTAFGVVPQQAWFTKEPEPGHRAFDARAVYETIIAFSPPRPCAGKSGGSRHFSSVFTRTARRPGPTACASLRLEEARKRAPACKRT